KRGVLNSDFLFFPGISFSISGAGNARQRSSPGRGTREQSENQERKTCSAPSASQTLALKPRPRLSDRLNPKTIDP
ncbi:hypothetical protein E2320_007884, partial [Naja naja]